MILTLATALADWDGWHHDGPGWWIVFVPLFWIAVITAVVLLLRRRPRPGAPRVRTDSGLDVLDRRFAAGEIDEAEYRRRRAVLDEQR